MEQQRWNTGDVVLLRSGSRPMTVSQVDDDGDVYCQWFADGTLHDGTFKPEMLAKYQAPRRR